MSDCLMVYYSDSGTTENLARSIASGLHHRGYRIDLINIRRDNPPAVHNYQLLGIGSPVYFFSPVPEMRRFISRLPDLNGMPAFTFLAYGTNPGNAADKLLKALKLKSACYLGTVACRNANFVYGCSRPSGLLALSHIDAEELERARLFGRNIPERLLSLSSDF